MKGNLLSIGAALAAVLVASSLDGVAAEQATDGLLLYYDARPDPINGLGRGSGTVWKDRSGNGNDGSLVGGAGFARSGIPRIELDGVLGGVRASKPIRPRRVTIEALFRIDAPRARPLQHIATVYRKEGVSGDPPHNSRQWTLEIRPDPKGGRLNFGIFGSDGKWHKAFARDALKPGWHHALGTFDGKVVRVYVDGALQQIAAFVGAINQPDDESVGVPAASKSRDAGHSALDGAITLVRIYGRALSPDEARANYREARAILPRRLPVPKEEPTIERFLVFGGSKEYPWSREQTLRRLPDGSLICVWLTGGRGDGAIGNVVAATRSSDDGRTWTEPEVLYAKPKHGAFVTELFPVGDRAYMFVRIHSKPRLHGEWDSTVVELDAGGKVVGEPRVVEGEWPRGPKFQCGTMLRDGRILFPVNLYVPFDKATRIANIGDKKYAALWHTGGSFTMRNLFVCAVLEPNKEFTEFARHGTIFQLTPDKAVPQVPLMEPQIAELSDGTLAMLIRADGTGVLYRSDSRDGGRTWSKPHPTTIPNPGTKTRILTLPDKRILLVHNPNPALNVRGWASRTLLSVWISNDDMKTWSWRRVIVPAPEVAMYPDAFLDDKQQTVYISWENGKQIWLVKLPVSETR